MENLVLETIADRRSIRSYEKKPVSEELIDQLMTAALQAPTARNDQSNEVLFITNPDLVRRIQDESGNFLKKVRPEMAADFKVFFDAPVLVLLSGSTENGWDQVDAGIIAENICLAAKSLGIGSCMVGMVKGYMRDRSSLKLREELGLSDQLVFELAVTLGYPNEAPQARPRDARKVKKI